MTGLQKATALTNLDGMYDESANYIDSITHASSYYTKAEAGAKYFPVGTKTANSVAATLDGSSAQQIISEGVPSGAIAIWAGAEADIPSGWVLCNGLNNSPDLRSRFVVGAGSTYSKGAYGGTDHLSLSEKTVTVAGQALTAAHLPSHRHPYTDYYRNSGGYGGLSVGAGGPGGNHSGYNTTSATSDTHTHSISFTGDDVDIMPKYWALCFLMKS